MAALPPHTIHVKRKRGSDEDAVDFLRLEETKRSRSSDEGGWIYQRKQPDGARAGLAAEPPLSDIPVIQATRDGDEKRRLKRPRVPAQTTPRSDAATLEAAPESPAAPTTPLTPATPQAPADTKHRPPTTSHPTPDRIRRFHLSRSDLPQPAAGVSKKRSVPAVFIERGAKKQRETLKAIIQGHNVTPARAPKPSDGSQHLEPSHLEPPPSTNEEPSTAHQPNPVKYKRPGTRACSYASNNKTLPASVREGERKSTNMDELARVMDDWTVDEITKNLDRMQAQSTKSKYSPATSRFKPKAPKQRYFERHPEVLVSKRRGDEGQPATSSTAAMDVDTGLGDTTDEEDYVLETYERVPAERLRDQAVPSHRVGLLVFDTEPDMAQFFYGIEGDSDDELPEDEEDENAENYYTADYPEEELDWDDEFDRNPYAYTNQNDSEREEYDLREVDNGGWDDDDNDHVGSFSGQSEEWRP